MEFSSFNFKLVVLDALLENGTLTEQLEALEDKYADEEWEDYYGPNPAIERELKQLPLTPEQLATVRSLCFDGGNEIYQLLAPNWDGEDGQFDVTDLAELRRLPNLEELTIISMVETADLADLLACPKLQKVFVARHTAKDDSALATLRNRGVIVQE